MQAAVDRKAPRPCCVESLIALTPLVQATLTPRATAKLPLPAGMVPAGPVRRKPMSKEKNRGNREAKKPKKVKPKVLATAGLAKPAPVAGRDKAK